MLKLPKNSRSYGAYYRKSYYNQGKSRPKISLLWIIISLPILIVLLELFAQAYLGITGKGSGINGNSPLVEAYKLRFLTETKKPIEGLTNQGELVVKRSPGTGYELVSGQKNQFLQINDQGLRDSEPLPLAKPKDEIRIFILGGSTAFGQLTPNNNATLSNQLEARLKQRVSQQKSSPAKYRPDIFPFFVPTRQQLMKLPPKIREGKYRVINAAVPGYTSGNELAQLALKILPYQPDLIVVLDGYGDLMLPSSASQTDIPHIDEFLADAQGHFRNSLNLSFDDWLGNTALVRVFNSLTSTSAKTFPVDETSLAINGSGKSLKHFLPTDQEELKRRVNRYRDNHQRLIQMASRSRIPIVLAIQPEITARPLEKLSAEEKNIRDSLGKEYLETVPKAYGETIKATQQLAKAYPKSVNVVDFYKNNSAFPTPMFLDTIHLTDKANTILAEKIYHAITVSEKIQIIPQHFYLKPVK